MNLELISIILGVVAIFLSLVALLPYVIDFCFYFLRRPKGTIQFANKRLEGNVLTFWLGWRLRMSHYVIEDVIIGIPLKDHTKIGPAKGFMGKLTRLTGALDKSDSPFERVLYRVTKINKGVTSNMWQMHALAIELTDSAIRRKRIPVQLTIEVGIDPLNIGFLRLWSRANRYRKRIVIPVHLDKGGKKFTGF